MLEENQQQKYNNGKRHSVTTRHKARELRLNGFTHREIARDLGVAVGTAHVWTKDIKLTEDQKMIIEQKRVERFRNVRIWTKEQRQEVGKRMTILSQKHTKQELLDRIRDFYKQYDRIPLKREFSNYRTFSRRFGTWNNAIIAAGFEPNPEFFAKQQIAKDNHRCDSFAEMTIDDWLYENGIIHERNRYYPNSKMTADFYISKANLYIEYFGLSGVGGRYDRNVQKKLTLVQQCKLKLTQLYPSDLVDLQCSEKLKQVL